MSDVDSLRSQLRDRGYLTHGIERWFALDPWSSRAFWLELITVAFKAAMLIAAFAALPMTAVMLFRNAPLGVLETFALFASYALAWLVAAFVFVTAIALILKIRPALPVDTPGALLAISLVGATAFVVPIAVWWWRFATAPESAEVAAGVALLVVFFLVTTIVLSAAFLSFSIYEVKRIPALHQKPRGVPMTIAAAVLIAMLFVPAYGGRDQTGAASSVVTRPTKGRVALIAVDGLTYELFQSRPDLRRTLGHSYFAVPIAAPSTTERWASVGTGVRTEAHGVRSIEGVRFRGSHRLIQQISRTDVVLLEFAPQLRVARREPLPPTVRRRDYAWEILAKRGIPSVSINWWATSDDASGGLYSVGPEGIFARSGGDPLKVDEIAARAFFESLDRRDPRFAAVYLPALDVILNRVELDRTARLTQSMRALDGVKAVIMTALVRGYKVVLIGMPGDGQVGRAVIASRASLAAPTPSGYDIAPTVLDMFGFPLSREMPGRSLARSGEDPRIASYGPRSSDQPAAAVNQEYYDNLRSLGYIR